ncbi:hypothetical protein GCM10010343_11920 [Streptomyces avidinii]|nr:hypothetical protein GCM10010343_11920 [Streptomyces avidinii]
MPVLRAQEQDQGLGASGPERGGHRFGRRTVVAHRARDLPAHPGGDPLRHTCGAQRGPRRVRGRGGKLPGRLGQERGRRFGQRDGSVADDGQVRGPVRERSRKVDVRCVRRLREAACVSQARLAAALKTPQTVKNRENDRFELKSPDRPGGADRKHAGRSRKGSHFTTAAGPGLNCGRHSKPSPRTVRHSHSSSRKRDASANASPRVASGSSLTFTAFVVVSAPWSEHMIRQRPSRRRTDSRVRDHLRRPFESLDGAGPAGCTRGPQLMPERRNE